MYLKLLHVIFRLEILKPIGMNLTSPRCKSVPPEVPKQSYYLTHQSLNRFIRSHFERSFFRSGFLLRINYYVNCYVNL